jgi:hypothetical protein
MQLMALPLPTPLLDERMTLALTLELSGGVRSPFVRASEKSEAVAEILADDAFLGRVLRRSVTDAEMGDLKRRMCNWARFEFSKGRKRKRTRHT